MKSIFVSNEIVWGGKTAVWVGQLPPAPFPDYVTARYSDMTIMYKLATSWLQHDQIINYNVQMFNVHSTLARVVSRHETNAEKLAKKETKNSKTAENVLKVRARVKR